MSRPLGLIVAALLVLGPAGCSEPDPSSATRGPTRSARPTTTEQPTEQAGAAVPADPWTDVPCPARTRDYVTGGLTWPAVPVEVRVCPSLGGAGAPADALVSGTDALEAAIADLPAADPQRCAALEPAPATYFLLVMAADGRTHRVSAQYCSDLRLSGRPGRRVAAEGVAGLVLDAIAAQRRTVDYPDHAPFAAIGCGVGEEGDSPISPTPDAAVVSGAVCGRERRRLSAAEVAGLSAAWSKAQRRPRRGPHADGCPGVVDGTTLRLRSAYGDVFRLEFNGCGNEEISGGPSALSARPWQVHLPPRLLRSLGLPTA